MTHIIEIVKITLPALIVFLTVYFLFTRFLQQQYNLENLKFKQNQSSGVIPLKLQAYERLIMLCERISIQQLSFRLSHVDMDANAIRQSMLIAIQQEYDHNLTQQLYVSENLWQIVTLAKNQIQEVVSKSEGHTPAEFYNNAQSILSQMKVDPLLYAKSAVKREADTII
ncbi:MAG: hypothetical protein IPM42_21280 [Saprospiraceae bacterium]|nr:hypothetical protein [Saprospiraceae bacterium]